MDFLKFINICRDCKNIAITAPESADGDSVGTQAALLELFQQHLPKVKTYVINEENIPKRYSHLAKVKEFTLSSDFIKLNVELDGIICVDGTFPRIGKQTLSIWENTKLKLLIDHHKSSNLNDYDCYLHDSNAASTTEIVYKLLKELKWGVTKDIAEALYVGLIFDTGMFKHSNTTSFVHQMAADLHLENFNHTETAEKSMFFKSAGHIDLLKKLLSNSKSEFDDSWNFSVIGLQDLKDCNAVPDDREGLIDFLFLREKCKVATLINQKDLNVWKISFRSRGPDVALLAKKLSPFGGGHMLASGCTIKGELNEVIEKCRMEISNIL